MFVKEEVFEEGDGYTTCGDYCAPDEKFSVVLFDATFHFVKSRENTTLTEVVTGECVFDEVNVVTYFVDSVTYRRG